LTSIFRAKATISAIPVSRLAHRLKALRLHRISAQPHLEAAPPSNVLDLDWTELMRLSQRGSAAAGSWMRSALEDGAPTRKV